MKGYSKARGVVRTASNPSDKSKKGGSKPKISGDVFSAGFKNRPWPKPYNPQDSGFTGGQSRGKHRADR